MDQPRWIPQLYGYTVCLIAVVTILISLNGVVNNAFEFAQPEMSREVTNEFGGRSLEACRQSFIMRTMSVPPREGLRANIEIPADSVLMRLCSEERAERVAIARHRAMRSLVTSSFMLLLALILFGVHWRWLRSSHNAIT